MVRSTAVSAAGVLYLSVACSSPDITYTQKQDASATGGSGATSGSGGFPSGGSGGASAGTGGNGGSGGTAGAAGSGAAAGSGGTSGTGAAGGTSGAAGMGPYATAVLADDPISYWRFDEVSGSSAANAIAGKPAGVATNVLFGEASPLGEGKSVLLNSSSTITFGNDSVFAFVGNAPYTIELLVRAATPSTTTTILSRWLGTPTQGYSLELHATGKLWARRVVDSSSKITTQQLPSQTWTHVAITYDGAQQCVILETSASCSGAPSGLLSTTAALIVGREQQVEQFGFSGHLDELAIYDKALTTTQLAAHRTLAGLP